VPRALLEDNAQLAGALASHASQVMEEGCVPPLTKQLCAAIVAGLNYCTPALVEHRKRARELGASTALLNDLWDSARSEHFTPAQKAALAAAVALTREPRGLPDPVYEALREHFSPPEIVEVLGAIGFENYRNRLQNALQI